MGEDKLTAVAAGQKQQYTWYTQYKEACDEIRGQYHQDLVPWNALHD
jgi:hypothetical protein